MSNVHPLTPRGARQIGDIVRPIVEGLDPAKLYPDGRPPSHFLSRDEIRRRIPDERPDIYETLRKAGYRRTWRDDLDDYVADVRLTVAYHATTAMIAAFVTLALVVAPFALGFLK